MSRAATELRLVGKAAEPIMERERFSGLLYTQPLVRSHAIVVLAGEDGIARADRAFALFQSGGAPTVVLSGGRHDGTRILGADALRVHLLGQGLGPDRITIESGSENTHEQAERVVDMAEQQGWTHLLLVASAYHLPRAFLTFLRTLTTRRLADSVRIVPVAVPDTWFASPPGSSSTRAELLELEWAKVGEYAEHVAVPAEGIAYLAAWEGR